MRNSAGWRIAAAALTAVLLPGQGVITTIAGTDWVFPSLSLPALEAPLGLLHAVAFDANGDLLVLDGYNQMVFRLGTSHRLSVVAGNGLVGFTGDGGDATRASMRYPDSMAVDRDGNIFVGDGESQLIRRIGPDRTISTIAGLGTRYAGDGLRAAESAFARISSLAATPAGELVVADSLLQRIFRIGADGIVSVLAGNGRCRSSGDGGPAREAEVCAPRSLAMDASSNIYFIDGNGRIRRITPNGVIDVFAGSGRAGRVRPGPGVQSPLSPIAIAVDASGVLLITSTLFNEQSGTFTTDLARVTSAGVLSVVDAPDLAEVLLTALCADSEGKIFVTTELPGRIFEVSTGGTVELVAGREHHRFGGDGGAATLALLSAPSGIAIDPDNNLFVADTGNGRIRKIGPGGGISTFGGDSFHLPVGVVLGPDGLLYVSSAFGLHRLNQDGTSEAFHFPSSTGNMAFDAENRLLLADRRNNLLRRFRDGAPGSLFQLDSSVGGALSGPAGVVIDPEGNIYVSESGAHRVRRISVDGTVTTFAGNGRTSLDPIPAGVRPAVSVPLTFPYGLALDGQGNLLVRSVGHLSRVTPSGDLEVIAGTGPSQVISGDGGLATEAALGTYGTVAVDIQGNIYLSETEDNRVRKILASAPGFHVSTAALRFAAASGGAPAQPQTAVATGDIPGMAFGVSVHTSDGGDWLRVSTVAGATPRILEVSANPAGLAPGNYSGTITFVAPLGEPRKRQVEVTFQVGAPLPANLQVDKTLLTFTYPPSVEAPRSQTLLLTNSGSGNIAVSVSATAGSFLRVTSAAGTVTAATPLVIGVEADPGTRTAGTYRGSVTIRGAGSTREVPVVMTIGDRDRAILLSQSGLSFQAVAGGGVVPPQTFAVLNQGKGSMAWRTTTSTLAGGPSWIQLSVAEGSSDATGRAPQSVDVRIDHTGLAPGVYYGLVQVDAPQAANSPHLLPVFLEVLDPDARPPSVVQPAELTFTAVEGGPPPGSKDLTVFNLTRDAIAYRSVASPLAPKQPVQYAPIDANVLPQEPRRLVVQPLTGGLRAGTYRSELTLQFAGGSVRRVDIRVIVTQRPGVGAASKPSRSIEACSGTQLIPVPRSIGQGSSVPVGWPAAVAVEVQDDCGRDMDEGTVTMSFSNGDPPVALQSLRGGRWHGTWSPRAGRAGPVTISLVAEDPSGRLRGEREVLADLRAVQDPPSLTAEGVVSSTAPVVHSPIAPGALITIEGERLTAGLTTNAPGNAAWPTRLGETEVLIGARRIPLSAVAPQRVDAVVPTDLAANTQHQVVVRRGLTYSRAVPVNVADAQPAILRAGGTQALATVVRDGSAPFSNGANSPASAGDRVTVFCTGLGAVVPAIEAGQAAPVAQIRTLHPVVARVGGRVAPVSFAGLEPGRIGRYQVILTIPAGTAAGVVPVELESQGQTSPAATLVVR